MGNLPDLNQSWPDLGHEAIRQVVVQSVDQLSDHVDQLADAFLIAETTADGLSIALASVTTLQQTVTDLARRVAALEAAAPTTTP